MGLKIHRCVRCGTYTLKEICPECKGRAANPAPARYSPVDPYGRYRRQSKMESKGHA